MVSINTKILHNNEAKIIKSILTIDPDYDQVLIDQDGCSYSFYKDGLLEEYICDKDGSQSI